MIHNLLESEIGACTLLYFLGPTIVQKILFKIHFLAKHYLILYPFSKILITGTTIKYLLECEELAAVVVDRRLHAVVLLGAHHGSKKFSPKVLFVVLSQFPHNKSAKGRIVNEAISLYFID